MNFCKIIPKTFASGFPKIDGGLQIASSTLFQWQFDDHSHSSLLSLAEHTSNSLVPSDSQVAGSSVGHDSGSRRMHWMWWRRGLQMRLSTVMKGTSPG